MSEREALVASVLEHIKLIPDDCAEHILLRRCAVALTAQQEPVVWMQSDHLQKFVTRQCGSQSMMARCSDRQLHSDYRALYTAPPSGVREGVPGEQARDAEWIIAMGHGLGIDSGFDVPIVPEVAPFQKLFSEIQRRSMLRAAEIAKDMDCAMLCGVGHEVADRITRAAEQVNTKGCKACGASGKDCDYCTCDSSPIPQPDGVVVPRYLVERAALLLNTAAEFGVESKWPDGTKTPNSELCEQTATALLAAAKEPRK